MTLVRMARLDADGNPTSVISEVEVSGRLYVPDEPFIGPCPPLDFSSLSRPVSISLRIARTKELDRVLFGPLSRHQRRYWKHRAAIRPVAKRRYKHGRVGVFR